MCDTPCSIVINENAQAVVTGCTGRRLAEGPNYCAFYYPCFETPEIVNKILLEQDMMVEIVNELEPERSQVVVGPKMVKLLNPWEKMMQPTKCVVLDQDDYLVIRALDGTKHINFGPGVYSPKVYGETFEFKGSAKLCPVNHYLVIIDADSDVERAHKPIIHMRGPVKFYPEPFQTCMKKTEPIRDINDPDDILFHPCIEVTEGRGCHLQRANGVVELLSKPEFYMPAVGEKVLGYVERIVMLTTNFCIVRRPDGDIQVMHGADPSHRAFFLKPFEEFVIFNIDRPTTMLSTLPTYLGHDFRVRTLDNVMLELVTRIQYIIFDVQIFCSNPIDFYTLLRNQIQNALLDRFAQVTLSVFMNSFASIAAQELTSTNETFRKFGIEVSDIQILTFGCLNVRTQELLMQDIHTNVMKQNELRATQTQLLIQEQVNEVKRKQKELEIQLILKDNEIEYEKSKLGGQVRLKELEIEINEEHKRTILLEVKRGNDMLEAEFEGRALGHEIREFMLGIDTNLTKEQKMDVYKQQCELHRRNILYEKVNMMTMYPTNVTVETIQITDGTVVEAYNDHMKEHHSQKISNNTFRKMTQQSKADANLQKIREEAARNSKPYTSTSSSYKYDEPKLVRLPTPPPKSATKSGWKNPYNNSSTSASSEGSSGFAPSPKPYVAPVSDEPVFDSKVHKFLDMCQIDVPNSPRFYNMSKDPKANNLKAEGDKCVQENKFQDAIMKYTEVVLGFPKVVNDTADKTFLTKIRSNRSLALMLLKANDIKRTKAYTTKDNVITVAKEAALEDCQTVLDSLDPSNIKCMVRGMSLADELKEIATRRKLAQQIMNLGRGVVGPSNYEQAQKFI